MTSLGNLAMIYDYSDQPTNISGTADGVGSANGSFLYDGNLKRVRSIVNGKTIYNVYDASGKLVHVHKVAGGNQALERSDYVSAGGKAIARVVHNGTAHYTFSDHLGSPVATMSGSSSTIIRERYTPFGIASYDPDVLKDQAGFTGHIKDSATGLNYMQARYYDPVMGRFLSIDPVDFVSSGYNPAYFNRYAYSGNDPINNIDPDGEFFQVVGFALGVASNVAIQTLVEGKSLSEVNVVEALTSGAVGATGLGAVSQGAKAIKAVRGAKQVSKNLKKAQRHAQSRRRRGKDTFNVDKKVNSLQSEIKGDTKDAVTAAGKAVGTAAAKKVIDETAPEVTVNDVGQAIGSAAQVASEKFDQLLENEVNR